MSRTLGRRSTAFTLVELLVVIGIIAVLISILLPSLNRARQSAVNVKNLSNLRQMAVGVENYRTSNKGVYPVAAWATGNATGNPFRLRWADAIFPHLKDTEVFLSPALPEHERNAMKKAFVHTLQAVLDAGGSINADNTATHTPTIKYFGGYGYNYQYLGNGRFNVTANSPYSRPFFASGKEIRNTAETIMFADTLGNKFTNGEGFPEGVYVVDPPLQSYTMGSLGSRRTLSASTNVAVGNYGYGKGGVGGDDSDPGTAAGDPETRDERSRPAERVLGKVAVVFCDGHGENLTRKQMDDKNGDGVVDNGYWTGRGDPQATFANRDKR